MMMSVPVSLLQSLHWTVRSRAALLLEVLALRHQLHVLQRTRPRRLRLAKADRSLWVWLSRTWTEWRTALVIVKPEPVIAWHRRGFRLLWTYGLFRLSSDAVTVSAAVVRRTRSFTD